MPKDLLSWDLLLVAIAYRLSAELAPVIAARPASRRAIGIRNGEQET